jgi:hypothetical protein
LNGNTGIPTKETSEYLIGTLFDHLGNYQYCHACCIQYLSINKNTLARYRKVVVEQIPQHGLMGKISNSSVKQETIIKLEEFLDKNSSANGRTSGKTKYLLPCFSQLYVPSNNTILKQKWTEHELAQCLLYVFNQHQEEQQLQTISNGTLWKLMHTRFSEYAIQPHKSDYCNDCDQYHITLQQCNAVLNCSDTVTGDQRQEYVTQKNETEIALKEHKI